MNELLGFSLSQEELLAILLIASLPAPMGFDDLETRVFGALPGEAKSLLLAATERSLIARGFLSITPDQSVLDEYMRSLLQTCTRPESSWIMLHQPRSEPQRVTYFHQTDKLFLAHLESAGIHQFLQLAGVQDVVDAAIQLVAPLNGQQANLMGHIPENVFAALTNWTNRPTANDVRTGLRKAGLTDEIAQAFAITLDRLVSITSFARFKHIAQAELQRAFTIVRSENTQWLLTLHSPGMLQMQCINGDALLYLLRDFGQSN